MRSSSTVGCALATSLAGALLFGAASAHASPPESEGVDTVAEERVLIRVVPNDDQVLARLRAELGVIGLDPVLFEVAEPTRTLGPDLLDELSERSASAAIEVVIGENRIDLWVADGNTGKALNRRLDLTLAPEQADPRTVAIAAVELLRASRLELGETDTNPNEGTQDGPNDDGTPQVDEGERPPDTVPPSLPSIGAISLGPVVGGSPGGFGVTTHVELAGRWAPLDRFALRFSVWIPTLGNSVDVADGSVRMFVGMAFVEPQLRLPGGARWFHPELGLGLGAAVTGFEGTAREGLRGATKLYGGFASHVHLGLGFSVTPRLWVRLDGYVGVIQPRPQIKSPATNVTEATWGLPFGTGSIGLEIWL